MPNEVAAWLADVPAGAVWVEPFAGANNLVRLTDARRPGEQWACYDIEPQTDGVAQRDTIADFPIFPGRTVAVVTNPPYLARNVARRNGMDAAADACGTFDNIYKAALAASLDGADWVCAVIPASFVAAGELTDRLSCVVIADRPMFVDTDVPVCVALFGPAATDTFEVWHGNTALGTRRDLVAALPAPATRPMRFNDPAGQVAIVGLDTTRGADIRFGTAGLVPAGRVSSRSRSHTRIAVDGLAVTDVADVAAVANTMLAELRAATGDTVLTPFRGLRADGRYRCRLPYALARDLLSAAVDEVAARRALPAAA